LGELDPGYTEPAEKRPWNNKGKRDPSKDVVRQCPEVVKTEKLKKKGAGQGHKTTTRVPKRGKGNPNRRGPHYAAPTPRKKSKGGERGKN